MTDHHTIPMHPSQDDRADLLRTSTIAAILAALGGGGHVYGSTDTEWSGTVLRDASTVVTTSRWTTRPGGRYRYDVVTSVEVRRTLEDPST